MTLSAPPKHSLLDAVAFAARAHRGQLRKDGETPYHSHVFRVCLIARHVFGIEDETVLTAAVLHDTIEDTTTDFDDVAKAFGSEIAGWVAVLSKDKRQQDEERERAYCAQLSSAPWQVKACKLADVYDNLTDSAHLRPEQRPRTYQRSRVYLEALAEPGLPPAVQRAYDLVSALLTRLKEGKG